MDTIVARPTQIEEATHAVHVITDGKSLLTPQPAKEMPLEVYETENHTPYIHKLLEVDDLLPVDVEQHISSIDEYITSLMKDKGYNPTTEAYRETLEGVKKDLGIDKNTSLETTVERISKYIEAVGILKSLKLVDEAKVLKDLVKSPTKNIMELVMKQVEKQGL